MSSSDGHAHSSRHPHLAEHFETIQQQDYAARLGMWLFLGTEVLLFAGLFLGYTVYRHFYHATWHACSQALNVWMGMGNTLVLISSSLTVALTIEIVRAGNGGNRADKIDLTSMMPAIKIENDRVILIKISLGSAKPGMQRRHHGAVKPFVGMEDHRQHAVRIRAV